MPWSMRITRQASRIFVCCGVGILPVTARNTHSVKVALPTRSGSVFLPRNTSRSICDIGVPIRVFGAFFCFFSVTMHPRFQSK